MGKEFRQAVAEIEETDESCSTDVNISHLVSYYSVAGVLVENGLENHWDRKLAVVNLIKKEIDPKIKLAKIKNSGIVVRYIEVSIPDKSNSDSESDQHGKEITFDSDGSDGW
jgi:hypothetical protein